MTTGLELTAAQIDSIRLLSTTLSTLWMTPSASTTEPTGSPGSERRALNPILVESPQTGERLASVARVRSSRSVFAFGVVCSCGRTPPAPSSTTSREPITPTMLRLLPVSSVNEVRYRVSEGSSSRCNTPSLIHDWNRCEAFAYASDGGSAIGKSM